MNTLTVAGFSLNIKKCKFVQTRILYLGRDISVEDVGPSKTKVKAITNSPVPGNVKQVC